MFCFSQHVLGLTNIDKFSMEFHTFNKYTVSFPIIPIVKLAKYGYSWKI